MDSTPRFFSAKAIGSAVAPNSETAIAYGNPTPTARICTGNNSALTMALIELYSEEISSAVMISAKAVQGSRVAANADSSGTVVNSASTPNVISIGRRPTRSDTAPITG